MRHRFGKTAVALTLTAVLAGCSIWGKGSADNKSSIKPAAVQVEGTVKILIMGSSEDSFFRSYGSALLAKFPNVDMQTVMVPSGSGFDPDKLRQEAEKRMDSEKADLVFSYSMPPEWMDGGRLLDLEPLIKRDKFDIENIHPGVVDTLRTTGKGRLYALSPTFSSSALIYNKDLFDRYQIPYPKDGMTWEEILKIAKRFPADGDGDSRIYGFYTGSPGPYELISQVARLAGLAVTNSDGTKVTITSDAWKRIWSIVIDAGQTGTVYFSPLGAMPGPGSTLQDSLKRDKFMTGNAAMAIAGANTINSFENYRSNGFKSFQWDLVSAPVDLQHPGESISFYAGDQFAITSQAPNQKAPWEMLRYLMSEPFAKVLSKSDFGFRFMARTSLNNEKEGHKMDAFFMLKPSRIDFKALTGNTPQPFFQTFGTMESEAAKEVMSGNKTLEQALRELEADGQRELDNLRTSGPAAGAGGGSK